MRLVRVFTRHGVKANFKIQNRKCADGNRCFQCYLYCGNQSCEFTIVWNRKSYTILGLGFTRQELDISKDRMVKFGHKIQIQNYNSWFYSTQTNINTSTQQIESFAKQFLLVNHALPARIGNWNLTNPACSPSCSPASCCDARWKEWWP